MSPEQNKKTLRRYYAEIFNKGDMSAWADLMDSDYVSHAGAREFKGLEGAKERFANSKVSAPDSKATVDEMVAEGDTVVVRGMIKGTNTGAFQGHRPTGKKFDRAYVGFYRFKNGKISEAWVLHDTLTHYQQLGINPPAAPGGR